MLEPVLLAVASVLELILGESEALIWEGNGRLRSDIGNGELRFLLIALLELVDFLGCWLWVRRATASSSLSVVVFLVVWSAMAMAGAGRTSVMDAG